MSSIQFDIITIFPDVFRGYFNGSIISRAEKKKLIKIKIWDLRKFTKDKHKKVDDRPYGGGPGMVLKIEPMVEALRAILKPKILSTKSETLIILFSAVGKQFDSRLAKSWSGKYKRIIMICGHYEGTDERIKKIVLDFGFRISCLSVGPYILTGGELPAMVVVDAVTRHIHGVLGKTESLEERRYGVGVPVYTRPEIFSAEGGSASGGKGKKYKVPPALLSGNHAKVDIWRRLHSK